MEGRMKLNLKFHHPKKDQRGLCSSYHKSSDIQKDVLRDDYEGHITEKMTVRKIKQAAKTKAVQHKT